MHQLENGYTRIANTIIEEVIKLQLSATGFKILFWIFRNSYGFGRKKTMAISIRDLGRNFNMDGIGAIHLALQVLLDNGLVVKNDKGELEFNKIGLSSVPKTEHLKAFPKRNTSVPETEQGCSRNGTECSQNGTPLNYKKENSKETIERKERKVFTPPSLEEVESYCKERNNSINPKKWLSNYEANGWMVGRSKMKNWKASIRYWETNDFGPTIPQPTNTKKYVTVIPDEYEDDKR